MADNENPGTTTEEPAEPSEPTEQMDSALNESAEPPQETTEMSGTVDPTGTPNVIPESSTEPAPLKESAPTSEPLQPGEPSTEQSKPAESAVPGEGTSVAGDTKKPQSVFSDESYACDRQYAIVLAQFITCRDREKVHAWIKR